MQIINKSGVKFIPFLFCTFDELIFIFVVMIKKRGVVEITDRHANTQEMRDSLAKLPDGKYEFWIIGQGELPLLPQLKYLNGVVLRSISEQLPDHPTIGALYRYFEKLYAPVHACKIHGIPFTYRDLKTEKSVEMDDVIEKIIHHAASEWNIKVPGRNEVSASQDREPYLDAYNEMWKNVTFSKHH